MTFGQRAATAGSWGRLRVAATYLSFALFASACSSLDSYTDGASPATSTLATPTTQSPPTPPPSTQPPTTPAPSTQPPPTDTADPSAAEGNSGSGSQPDGASAQAPPTTAAPPAGQVPVITPVVITTLPHDTAAFTQGLELADGILLESVGLRGQSATRRVVVATGEVSDSVSMEPEFFAAGLTVANGAVYQLSWQAGVLIISDPQTLQELERRSYDGEGWGICSLDENRIAMSDGSDLITFRDPVTFERVGEVAVTLDGEPLDRLNELECVNGNIWANVWLTSNLVQIDPATGQVLKRVDASGLVPEGLGTDDVLNGIAFNPETATFFLTGKRWPVLYEVDLGPV